MANNHIFEVHEVDRKAVRQHCKVGQELILVREPVDAEDYGALTVWLSKPKIKVGALHRIAKPYADAMDAGKRLRCRVHEMGGGGQDEPNIWMKVEISEAGAVQSGVVGKMGGLVKRVWSAGWLGKVAIFVLGCFVFSCVVSVFSGGNRGTQISPTPTSPPQSTAVQFLQASSVPASLMAPSATPQPAPSATLLPTVAPSPLPTAEPPLAPTAEPTARPTQRPAPTAVLTKVPAVATVAEAPTLVPAPTDVPPPTEAPVAADPRQPKFEWNWGIGTQAGSACTCSKPPDLNCADFASWGQSQACFEKCGGVQNDVYGLDGNDNAVVCERPR